MTAGLPPAGLVSPKLRTAGPSEDLGLPAGTRIFSADSHLALSEDIWFERFPASMKDRAPRVWLEDGMFQLGSRDRPLLADQFKVALAEFDGVPGGQSDKIGLRLADLDAEGVDEELVFPSSVPVLFWYPDLEVRSLCFRIYNEYIAELQQASGGRFHGVGFINWWDPKGTRRSLAELHALGIRTFLLPMKAPAGIGSDLVDWTSAAMRPFWDEVEEAGLPVSHHIGEAPQMTEVNPMPIGFVFNASSFREMFSKYIFGGILDRHPKLQVGWFEGGINWVVPAIQDAEHGYASYRSTCNWKLAHDITWYWRNHMVASFMLDPLGLELIDRIGTDRAMWSSDYPHNEGSFGYSRSAIRAVVDAVGRDVAAGIVGDNVRRFLGLNA